MSALQMESLNILIDGSDDGLISCFKKEKKCKSGKGMLESQLKIFIDSTQ